MKKLDFFWEKFEEKNCDKSGDNITALQKVNGQGCVGQMEVVRVWEVGGAMTMFCSGMQVEGRKQGVMGNGVWKRKYDCILKRIEQEEGERSMNTF